MYNELADKEAKQIRTRVVIPLRTGAKVCKGAPLGSEKVASIPYGTLPSCIHPSTPLL